MSEEPQGLDREKPAVLVFSGSRSSIVSDQTLAKQLWDNGCFGSSTRSTRFMPEYLAAEKRIAKSNQKHKKRPREDGEMGEDDAVRPESLQMHVMEAKYVKDHVLQDLKIIESGENVNVELDFPRPDHEPTSSLTLSERYAVYSALRRSRWIPKHGALYGCDFVLYERDPNDCHSKHCLVIQNPRQPASNRSVLGHLRVAEQIRKTLVVSDTDGKMIEMKRWVCKHEQSEAAQSVAKKKSSHT